MYENGKKCNVSVKHILVKHLVSSPTSLFLLCASDPHLQINSGEMFLWRNSPSFVFTCGCFSVSR